MGSVVIDGECIDSRSSGANCPKRWPVTAQRISRRHGEMGFARRHRRPGALQGTGAHPQGRNRHRVGGRGGRWGHLVHGHAQHPAPDYDPRGPRLEVRAGRPGVAGQLLVLHRCHQRQLRGAPAGRFLAGVRREDLHGLVDRQHARRQRADSAPHLCRDSGPHCRALRRGAASSRPTGNTIPSGSARSCPSSSTR